MWNDENISQVQMTNEFGKGLSTIRLHGNILNLGKKAVSSERRVGSISNMPRGKEEIQRFVNLSKVHSNQELASVYEVSLGTIEKWKVIFRKELNDAGKLILDIENLEEPNYEELIALAKVQQKIVERLIGYKTEVRAEIKTSMPVVLVFTADWHLGSEGVDYESFDRDKKFMSETDNLYVYIGGDGTDNFIQASKISTSLHNQQPMLVQKALFKRTVEELKNKIVALGTGNHEWWSTDLTGVDDIKELTKNMGILYTQHGGMLKLTVGNIEYMIYRHHKYAYNSNFNLTHTVKRMWEFAPGDFDVGVVEHRHVASIEPFARHGQEKWGIRTGSYKVYDEYALQKGFYGVEVANPAVVLYPDEKRIVGFKYMEDAVKYLRGVV